MASPDARALGKALDEGLSKVAHAVRRSAALREAISISEPDATIDQMLKTADRLALWLRGSAEDEVQEPKQNPWEDA